MTELESALIEIASFLDEMRWPYMLIGGLAVAMWGEPRATLDVDLSVWIEPDDFEQAIGNIASRFRTAENPLEFARRSRVVPIETSQGVRGDIVLAALPPEREFLKRARPRPVGSRTIPVASPEDLILMKLMSERPKDLEDARRLIRRFRATLDKPYLEPKLKELADGLARADIWQIYETEA